MLLFSPVTWAGQCSVFSTPRSLSISSVGLQSLHWTPTRYTWWVGSDLRLDKYWWDIWGSDSGGDLFCPLLVGGRLSPHVGPGSRQQTCHSGCSGENWELRQITTDNWLLSGWEFPDCSPRRQQSRRSINPARRDGQVRGLFLFLVDVNISLLSFRLESVSTWEFHSCYKIPGGCQSSLFSIQETISEKTSSLVGCVSRNSWWQAPG